MGKFQIEKKKEIKKENHEKFRSKVSSQLTRNELDELTVLMAKRLGLLSDDK